MRSNDTVNAIFIVFRSHRNLLKSLSFCNFLLRNKTALSLSLSLFLSSDQERNFRFCKRSGFITQFIPQRRMNILAGCDNTVASVCVCVCT